MKHLIVSATLLSLISPQVLAQSNQPATDEGLYFGAGLGQATLDNETLDWLDDMGANTDDSDTSYKLFLGYQFNQNFAVEASYLDFGEFTADANAASNGYSASSNLKLGVEGFGIALVGKLPIKDGFSVYGKLGMVAWDGDASVDLADSAGNQFSDSTSADDTDPFYGLGAEYVFNQLMFRGEFERYDISESDEDFEIDLFSASIGYRL